MKTFKVTENGQEIELKAKMPSISDQREAEKQYRKAFKAACDNGDYLRISLDTRLRKQGLWDDQLDMQYKTLLEEIRQNERKILTGGIKASEGRRIALENKKKREEIQELLNNRSILDNVTVEAQAENARFDCLVSSCTVYSNNDKPYFKSYDDYCNRKDSIVGWTAASNLASLINDYDENYKTNLTENKFLKKMGFVDDKYRLINKDGHLIDKDGKLIDEFGYYVDEQGKRVDVNGEDVSIYEEGALDKAVFLDDDGNPIVAAVEDTVQEGQPVETAT